MSQVKRYENIFINLNKKNLDKGESTKGEIFGTYSLFTERLAKTKTTRKPKIAGRPYNFQDTGGLFDKMKLDFKKNEAVFTSKDSKTNFLKSKYPNLLGIKEKDSARVFNDVIRPALLIQIKELLSVR